MPVIKAKRKPSQFEVFHHLYKMRKEITDLLLRNFGYDSEKSTKRLTAMRRKMKSISCKLTNKEFTDFFYSWFKANKKYMSNKQKENMLNLFKEELLCTQ